MGSIVPLQHTCSANCSTVQWCIALQATASLAYIKHIRVRSCASVADVRRKILNAHCVAQWQIVLIRWVLLRRRIISEVKVSLVSPSQLECQSPPYLAHFHYIGRHELLTSALWHPRIFSHVGHLILDNERFVSNVYAYPLGSQRALLLSWEYDNRAMIAMGLFVTVLSLVAGVLVGIIGHNASLGIAVSSGLAAVLSCLEVLVVWQFR